MHLFSDPLAVQAEALRRRSLGQRVGFVPTMGFLHAGHTALMDQARSQCDWLVVSIFVNPLQFGPNEDLDRYPRDPEGDAEKCRAHGVDAVLLPDGFYPPGHSTQVAVSGLSDGLCGARRPGHFAGVTTVVARLFGLVQPHMAVFGEKDFQQLAVIRRMVRDLALPVDVQGAPIVRDADGLALSSRNKFLDGPQRARALSLSASLRAAQTPNTRDVARLLTQARANIDADRIDYLALVDPDSLLPMQVLDRPARMLVAAFYGSTRLIDNMAIPAPGAP